MEVTIKVFPREIAIFVGPRMYAVIKIHEARDILAALALAEEVKNDLERGLSRKPHDPSEQV